MARIVTSLLLLCTLVSAVCSAEQESRDRPMLAVEDSWPPYADENGLGYATSVVVAAYRAVGIEPEIHVQPYARVLKATEDGRVDGGYNVTRQATTEAVYYFAEQPILVASASFFTLPGDDRKFGSIEDVPDGFSIGLIKDYEYGDQYEKHRHRFREVRVNTQKQLIQMLLSGRIEAVILFDEVANFNLEQMGLQQNSLQARFVNHVSDIYVAFNKSDRVAHHWARELNRGLKLIIEQGIYNQIFDGSLVPDYQPIRPQP